MVTPWDVFRYGFWGGLALILFIALFALIIWLYNRWFILHESELSKARDRANKLEWKVRELEAKLPSQQQLDQKK